MVLKFKNGEEYYYKIFQMFNLSVALTLLPFGYLVLEKHAGNLVSIPIDSWVYWFIAIPTVSAIVALLFWTKKKHAVGQDVSKKFTSLRAKLSNYYFVLRSTYFLYGIACILTVALLWTTGSGIYIVVYVVVMVLLSLNRPTLNMIIEDLQLDEEQEKCLVDKLPIEEVL